MRSMAAALVFAASLCLSTASHASGQASKQAWFYLDSTSQQWCSVITDADAKAASNDDRFDWGETAWLRYHGSVIDSIMVTSQSEDAYEEDAYTFDADLSVMQVVRKGHYSDDPFLIVTFKPDAHKRLVMTAQSKRAVKKWPYLNYFQDWPLYASLKSMPFAHLIRTKAKIEVKNTC